MLAGAFAGGLGLAGAQTGPPAPNVLVIMTDDQTLESMRVMPEVRSLLADQGTTFSDFFGNVEPAPPSRNFVVDSSLAGGLAPGATLRPLAGTAIPDA